MTAPLPDPRFALTRAETIVFEALPLVRVTAIDVRDSLGFARTTTARKNVETVLDRLVEVGLVERDRFAGLTTYRRLS